ncbi:hypothetical protein HD806DRAFT_523163 [Xylariaceae sp. AK1471]|nr:hypothetical protein HD806DRAFT_523163 [Xylariaceae sp. AK1471]
MIAEDSYQANTLGVGQSFYRRHLCTDISDKRYLDFPLNEVIRKLRAWSDRLAGTIRRLPTLLKRLRDMRNEIWDVSLPTVFYILQQRKQDPPTMVNQRHWTENFEWVVESGVWSPGKCDYPDEIWVRISNIAVGYYLYQGKSSTDGLPYLPVGDGQMEDVIFMDMARSHGLYRVVSNMAPLMKVMKTMTDYELGCLNTTLRYENTEEYKYRNRLRCDDPWGPYFPEKH